MLEHGIRRCYVETAVPERQTDIRLDPQIADGGKGDLKFSTLSKPASGDLVWMRVAPFQEIRSGISFLRAVTAAERGPHCRSEARLAASSTISAARCAGALEPISMI